jgi:molybdate transport system regulatory protein
VGLVAKLTLRIDFDSDRAIGPGKVRLLELIDELSSIAAAGRAMGMSYRRAWLLVDNLNRCFREPVVAAQHGGRAGGGAALTAFGRSLVDQYRAIEADAGRISRDRLRALQGKLRASGSDLAVRSVKRR